MQRLFRQQSRVLEATPFYPFILSFLLIIAFNNEASQITLDLGPLSSSPFSLLVLGVSWCLHCASGHGSSIDLVLIFVFYFHWTMNRPRYKIPSVVLVASLYYSSSSTSFRPRCSYDLIYFFNLLRFYGLCCCCSCPWRSVCFPSG